MIGELSLLSSPITFSLIYRLLSKETLLMFKQMIKISVFTVITMIGTMHFALHFAQATEYTWKDCSKSEKTKIETAVNWLKNNMSKIDAKMGKNGIKSWPGKSRDKFIAKLDKKLKFRCRQATSKMCTPKEVSPNILRTTRGKVIPILHQRRIDLCLANIADSGNSEEEDEAYLVAVIAHEIGHLIRLNAQHKNCVQKYENPRFSQSLGLATFHARVNTEYKASEYTSRCP